MYLKIQVDYAPETSCSLFAVHLCQLIEITVNEEGDCRQEVKGL